VLSCERRGDSLLKIYINDAGQERWYVKIIELRITKVSIREKVPKEIQYLSVQISNSFLSTQN